jgi:hypothetical protein
MKEYCYTSTPPLGACGLLQNETLPNLTSAIACHTLDTIRLIICLEIWKIYYRREYESPVAQNRNVLPISLELE